MKIVKTQKQLRKIIADAKGSGKRIGFVPTMGALHGGHLSLVETAKKKTDFVVVSIFVNPIQFGKNEDLSKYPRDLDKDSKMLRSVGADLLFFPSVELMYPNDFSTYVEEINLTQNLCGASRPGHFKGVTTVVSKLFNLVLPDFAFFGKKDYQQLSVISKMVKDLNFPIKVIGCSIIRDKSGLAMSSRNAYLSSEERKDASLINIALKIIKEKILEKKIKKHSQVEKEFLSILSKSPCFTKLDYVRTVDIKSLAYVENISTSVLIAIAVYFGKTRLIDNIEVFIGETK